MTEVMERVSAPLVVSDFVRQALTRLRNAPLHFFSEEEQRILDSCDGPVVSGDPDGWVPDNLEDDDNE